MLVAYLYAMTLFFAATATIIRLGKRDEHCY
jgi:hypothetical protein